MKFKTELVDIKKRKKKKTSDASLQSSDSVKIILWTEHFIYLELS